MHSLSICNHNGATTLSRLNRLDSTKNEISLRPHFPVTHAILKDHDRLTILLQFVCVFVSVIFEIRLLKVVIWRL